MSSRRRVVVWSMLSAGVLCATSSARAQAQNAAAASPSGAETSMTFGKGATIRARDESASLTVRARGQFQAAYETNTAAPNTGRRPLADTDFMVRRLRLLFTGHALSKALQYYIQLGFSYRDQEPDRLTPLRDARIMWTAHRDLSLWAGQMKVPFSRERVISSSALQMVDRSNLNAELSLDRDVGLMITSKDFLGTRGVLRYYMGVFGGDGRNRTGDMHGLLWVARTEVNPLGNFEDYSEVDFERSTKPKLSLGVATAYNEATARTRSTFTESFKFGTLDYRHASADVMLKLYGASLQAEAIYRRGDKVVVGTGVENGKTVTEAPRNAWGFMLQAGVRVTSGLEAALRYSDVRPLDDSNKRMVRDREVGGALSYYWHKHDLKLQLDYFRLLTDTDPAGTATIERDRVRVQTQVFF